ncbi:unnamed protein product [Schistosoma spindalis]|nr:unnamed protein product [Schistosoma spindale]
MVLIKVEFRSVDKLCWLIFKDYVFQGDGWICWCCVTFIVIIFTKDYLDRHREHFTETYTIFIESIRDLYPLVFVLRATVSADICFSPRTTT